MKYADGKAAYFHYIHKIAFIKSLDGHLHPTSLYCWSFSEPIVSLHDWNL